MRRFHGKLYGMAWFIFMVVLLIGMFSASFYLTAFIYKIIHLHPPAVLVQIVNSLLGLVFSGLIVSMIVKFVSARGWLPERNVFNPIVEALEKIAKGDFSVRLDSANPDNQMVGVLANSVNKMALELEQMENSAPGVYFERVARDPIAANLDWRVCPGAAERSIRPGGTPSLFSDHRDGKPAGVADHRGFTQTGSPGIWNMPNSSQNFTGWISRCAA